MKHRIFAGLAFGAALFAVVTRTGWTQPNDVGPIPQAVVTREDTFLPGLPQMIAPANSTLTMHPQGRYVLACYNEAATLPASLLHNSATETAALILYDARLRRVRTLWEGHAPHRDYGALCVYWLAQSDCALALTWDGNPVDDAVSTSATPFLPDKLTLLFFNFAQSLTGRAIAVSDSPGNMRITLSPTKPYFSVDQDDALPYTLRIGSSARGGALGPAFLLRDESLYIDGWSADGTSIYGSLDDGSGSFRREWFIWDGKSPNVKVLPAPPDKAQLAPKKPLLPALTSPLTLRTGAAITVPASLPAQTPSAAGAKADATPAGSPSLPPVVLHPLYLETADTAPAKTNPNRSILIAPDADTSYLMPDQSAVLYQKSGATYVVPLTRIKTSAFAQLQKDVALANANELNDVLSSYARSGNGTFPTKKQLSEVVNQGRASARDGEALLQAFVYTPPTVPLQDIDAPETVVVGYVVTPKGRAVVYAKGGVKWEATP